MHEEPRRWNRELAIGVPLPPLIDCVRQVRSLLATSRFHTTSWSLVAAAAEPTESSRQALGTLCQAYWQPIYAFIRRNGYDRDQACDLPSAGPDAW
jgi:hypothetical protein